MKTVRSVLNGLKWRSDRDLSRVEVEYVHRGAPRDLARVGGSDILELEPWMMVIRSTGPVDKASGTASGRAARGAGPSGPVPGLAAIPYHRIVRIFYNGEVVFDRSRDSSTR